MFIANQSQKFRGFAIVFATAFALLFGIFLKTMLHHYQGIDYPYLWYAIPRIGLIAIVTGLLGLSVGKKHPLVQVIFGVVVGFVLAVFWVKFGLRIMT